MAIIIFPYRYGPGECPPARCVLLVCYPVLYEVTTVYQFPVEFHHTLVMLWVVPVDDCLSGLGRGDYLHQASTPAKSPGMVRVS